MKILILAFRTWLFKTDRCSSGTASWTWFRQDRRCNNLSQILSHCTIEPVLTNQFTGIWTMGAGNFKIFNFLVLSRTCYFTCSDKFMTHLLYWTELAPKWFKYRFNSVPRTGDFRKCFGRLAKFGIHRLMFNLLYYNRFSEFLNNLLFICIEFNVLLILGV